MKESRKLILEIDSLALHGVARADARSLVAAMERELGRLLADPRAARTLSAAPGRRDHVRAASTAREPAARSSAAGDGASIARATFGALVGRAGRSSR
jgi:hypothetical protein